MCGIWAIFGSSTEATRNCAGCFKIAHRGPDAFRLENIHNMKLKNCALGFHRLAIMDDMHGMQPMKHKAHPHVLVIYNGEIYNYPMLKKKYEFPVETDCDAEIIVHLYAHGGFEFCVQQLDGVFAFALLDMKEKKVYFARDTYGIKPCFSMITDDGFLAVCSEAKGLMGISQQFQKRKHEVRVFQPGMYEAWLLDENGHASFSEKKRFHKIGDFPKYETNAPQLVKNDSEMNIRIMFEAAVKKRMQSHRRIGCMLSGGLDSSLVSALVCKFAEEMSLEYPVQTFAIGMEGSPDLAAAKKVADHIGSEHHEVLFTAEEGIEAIDKIVYYLESYDITTVRASVGMYLLSKYISEQTDTVVVFSGEGSDELAQGYIYFHKSPSAQEGDSESRRLLNDLYHFDVLRADRSTAAHGLEVRVPFLDHYFTSYYLSLSADIRKPHKGIEKFLIRSAFSGSGLLPDEILWRPKEAFSDGIASKKKSWCEYLQEHLNDKISDEEMSEASKLYPYNTPQSKEAYYYRHLFESHYPAQAKWIPYFWMPKWSTTDDPSARTLDHYKNDEAEADAEFVEAVLIDSDSDSNGSASR